MADEFKSVSYEDLSPELKAIMEANAKGSGFGVSSGKEYFEKRGGTNASGYFGDSYTAGKTLNDQEYAQAIADAKTKGLKGTEIGAAINAASMAKEAKYWESLPLDRIPNKLLVASYQMGNITKDQFNTLLASGYADARYKDTVAALNSGSIKQQPLGVDNNGKLFYGYDKNGNLIYTPNSIAISSKTSQQFTPQPIGTLSDGRPLYGWDDKGNPVTSPSGSIYSTTSSTDAVSRAGSGARPLSIGSSATGSGAFGTGGSAVSDAARTERQSAYDLLLQQFNQYGLGALVTPLKDLIITGASPAEFTIKLRETDAYKKRFAGNAERIAKGLKAISEAEYLGLEDQYQNIMRNYGLPADYYTRGDMGRQEGFEKFIGNDVSAAELEDRIATAQKRVINANPEVLASLKTFYPDITNADILAYTLDPTKGLEGIKRKVTAAEIGGAATQAGLGITGARAEELGAAGINKAQAQQGFQTVAEVAPRGGQLAAIYGESPYTQQTAEQEVFGLAGSTEAAKQRKKLTGLERAAFSGQTGAAQGALARERAGNF